MEGHLPTGITPRRSFAESVKAVYAKEAGVEVSNVMSVSFTPCFAQKYTAEPAASEKNDFVLSAGELARMIKLAGIMIETLPEEQFDSLSGSLPNQNISAVKETVHGFVNARKVLEDIRKGECKIDWIEITCCPGGCVLSKA